MLGVAVAVGGKGVADGIGVADGMKGVSVGISVVGDGIIAATVPITAWQASEGRTSNTTKVNVRFRIFIFYNIE